MSEETSAARRTRELDVFWFLVDAPMFTDDSLIARFHDAVLRPERQVVAETEVEAKTRETENKAGVKAKVKGGVPFVVKLAGEAKFDRNAKRIEHAGLTRQLEILRSPERQLEELVAFYIANFPERILRVDPVNQLITLPAEQSHDVFTHPKLDEVCDEPGPRPLVLIDCPHGTRLMPMAGEFISGKVEVIYDDLVDKLSQPAKPLRRFDRRSRPSSELKAQIWQDLIGAFDARAAMHVLEAAGEKHGGSAFQWIDFRLPWGDAGEPGPFHLHIVPSGRYSMGTFANAFVNRGYSQGVRIVGSLKTGGDVNVLAIYER